MGKQLPVDESLSSNITAITPNQLYKACRTIIGNELIVDPKEKVNNSFVSGAANRFIKQWKAHKELNE